MKSAVISDEIQNLIDRMSQNDTEAILLGAKSNIPILNLNSILFGTKFKITEEEFLEVLKTKLLNSDDSFMGTPLKIFAVASLDVLGVQKYTGKDAEICNLINSILILIKPSA